jgi:triosephosphate isomerase
MHWEAQGAYTGEISADMLRDLYCHYVILGHSERRTYFHETDAIVNRKVRAACAANLIPILCVGETLQERDGGRMREVVRVQLEGGLADVDVKSNGLIVAYEPVWAIGTGRVATPAQAQEMHAFIRETLVGIWDEEIASGIRIQYGGSMKPDNAAALLGQPDIDGGLIGGASLEARPFVEIVRAGVPPSENGADDAPDEE